MTSSTIKSNPNYFIALDDRVDLISEVLATNGQPTASDREQAANLKRVVFDGITTAVENGLAKSSIGLWADSDLGESVLLRAKAMELTTASSPQSGTHSLSRFNVDYTAVQLTLNPDGPEEGRKELLEKLKIVSDQAREESKPLMIELDSIPNSTQIEMYGGFSSARAMLVIMSIQQLQDAGVHPSIWAFEPAGDETFTAAITAQAHVDDRENTVLIVVAGGLADGQIGNELSQTDKNVISLAARTIGVSGVLIGPGAYYRHLVQLNEGIIERDEAVEVIAAQFGDIGEIFEKSRTTSEVL
jgi:myo-inositol catabolism protein IolC|tara:strand:+ start:2333 stop:3235 length:903 start_codon:yes stop_codon:yes gene_type:complete